MSKIVFFCIPAHGHTNPTLGVVRELVAGGHEVWYYSYEMMRTKIEATGALFVACDAYDPQTRLSVADGERIGKDLAFSTNLIVDMTLALDDAVCRDLMVLRPDCIVGDSMAFWAKLIARKLSIPFVSSTTTFAFNRYSAKVMKQGDGSLLALLLSMPKINRSLNRLRAKGYEVKSVLDLIQNDNETDTVVYTSPEFQPCADTFSDRYAFVGPILRPTEQPITRDGRKTVYISLGTVNHQHPDFYRNCLAAFRDADYRVIMTVGGETDLESLGSIPGNFEVAPYVDQIAVLEITDLFLTHCGMNSVSEALYHGVPLVLYPQTPEQQGVANRVLELGAGQMLTNDDPEMIRRAADAILANDTCRAGAQKIADSFHRCGGAKQAADFIVSRC